MLPFVMKGETWVYMYGTFPDLVGYRRKRTVPNNGQTGHKSARFDQLTPQKSPQVVLFVLCPHGWLILGGHGIQPKYTTETSTNCFTFYKCSHFSLAGEAILNRPRRPSLGGHLQARNEKARFALFAAIFLETPKMYFNIRKSFDFFF